MRVFHLEYTYKASYSGLTRSRSFFYRPEYVADAGLWKAIRLGNDIKTDEDLLGSSTSTKITKQQEKENRERVKKLLDDAPGAKSGHRHRYR